MDPKRLEPAGPVSQIQPNPPLKRRACIACKIRKVKCDKQSPCTNCMQWSSDCVFPSPIRKCRRSKKLPVKSSCVSPAMEGSVSSSNQYSLEKRMQKLEETIKGLVSLEKQHNGTGVTQNGLNHSYDSTMSYNIPLDEGIDALEAKVRILTTSRDRVNILPADFLHAVSSSSSSNSTRLAGIQQVNLSQSSLKLFPLCSLPLTVGHLDPAPARALVCWKVFQEFVDPHIKVLHGPSVELILQKASTSRESLEKSETAMLLTVYFASVTCMPAQDVEKYFRCNKAETLSKYRVAAEHALMQANVLTSEDTTTLQAFILFLSLHNFINETSRAWALTALARRLSSGIVDLSPFEQEMRCRLSWQLYHLDFRAVVDQGKNLSFYESMMDAKLPLNVFDADLFPDMLQLPPPRDCWTEMSFSLIQYNIDVTASATELTVCPQEKEALISDCENRIHGSYLRHCNGSLPSHWLAEHIAYVHTNEMRFRYYAQMPIHIPPLNLQAIQEQLFHRAIDIVDTGSRVNNEPQAREWLWSLSGYMQFAPLMFLLTELCRRREPSAFEMAWTLVENAFCRWADDIKKTRKGRQIQELIECAREEKRRIEEVSVIVEPVELSPEFTTSFLGEDLGDAMGLFSDLDFSTIVTQSDVGSDVDLILSSQPLSTEDINKLFFN